MARKQKTKQKNDQKMLTGKKIAVMHCTATNLTFSIFDHKTLQRCFEGRVVDWNTRRATVFFSPDGSPKRMVIRKPADAVHAFFLHWLEERQTLLEEIVRAGHFITFGGEQFTKPVVVEKSLYRELWGLNRRAPLHNPFNVQGLEALVGFLPNIPHVAVFDTMLFSEMPSYQFLYGLPMSFYEKYGIRKFAFNGLTHESALEQWSQKNRRSWRNIRIISCVVDTPSSVAAFDKGQLVDATASFSPVEKCLVVSRNREIDPFVVLAILQDLRITPDHFASLLSQENLISGKKFDSSVQKIWKNFTKKNKKSSTFQKARNTLDLYLFDLARNLSAGLGLCAPVDAVVFSGSLLRQVPSLIRWLSRSVPLLQKIPTVTIQSDPSKLIARYTRDL